jgi:hypothetical protein
MFLVMKPGIACINTARLLNALRAVVGSEIATMLRLAQASQDLRRVARIFG